MACKNKLSENIYFLAIFMGILTFFILAVRTVFFCGVFWFFCLCLATIVLVYHAWQQFQDSIGGYEINLAQFRFQVLPFAFGSMLLGSSLEGVRQSQVDPIALLNFSGTILISLMSLLIFVDERISVGGARAKIKISTKVGLYFNLIAISVMCFCLGHYFLRPSFSLLTASR